MTGSKPSADAPRPHLGVSYPVRFGKSLRPRRAASARPRDLLTLKFTHVPNRAALAHPGTLTRTGDKCAVHLPTDDGPFLHFTGQRKAHTTDSQVNDYVLIFVNGSMWLERTSDVFYGMRHAGNTPPSAAAAAPAPVPLAEPDDVRGDPDSWMSAADEDNGSPITPEGPEGRAVEDVPPVPSRVAGKSTTPMGAAARKLVSAGRVSPTSPPAPPAPHPAPTRAAKTVAGKSVAGKGLSNSNGPVGRRRTDDDDDDDDNNNSSSDDDDSDSDGSDSDSDSAEYTDESSDED